MDLQILEPLSAFIRGLPAGFLIPGAIAFVLSFPPLFGHEIIAILCGAEYGLYAGFAIIAVGTIVGEGIIRSWLSKKTRRLSLPRCLRSWSYQKTRIRANLELSINHSCNMACCSVAVQGSSLETAEDGSWLRLSGADS